MLKRLVFAAAAFCFFGFAPVFAVSDGVYLTVTNTYYLNPDTGVTDDGGSKNAALGEGMCRSVVYGKALAEIDGGKVYATVRLQLMSNMRDFRLFVQDAPGGGYTKVTPRVTAEDAGADTADYRFELPSVGAYISWEMYVIPMGRDVKFYMNLSESLTEGSGDFVVSVKPKTGDGESQAAEAGQEGAGEAPAQADTGQGDAAEASAPTDGAAAATPESAAAPDITPAAAAPEPSGDAGESTAPREIAVTSSPAREQTAPPSTAAAPGIQDAAGAGSTTPPSASAPSESDEAAVAAVPGQASGTGGGGSGGGGSGGLSPILIIAAILLIAAAGASLWLSMKRKERA
ncbi:MAG: hypothetical protein LBL26_10200 [Peptococcaceae bacterium]|jgi:hypothetical protein|nr:hypothetical protein [Peptococcaceae bacterium]